MNCVGFYTRIGRALGSLLALGVAFAPMSFAADADCLRCHGDPAVAAKEAPNNPNFLVNADHLGASAHGNWECVDCHEGIDAEAKPHREEPVAVDCFGCHDPLGDSHAFHPNLLKEDVPAGKDTQCTACHASHDTAAVKSDEFPFRRAHLVVSCGQCHEAEAGHFAQSAHGHELTAGVTEAPDCISCHSGPKAWQRGTDVVARKQAEVAQCESCHASDAHVADRTVRGAKFAESFLTSIHGSALARGEAKSASCVDCHGAHEMNRAAVAGARIEKTQIATTCAKCHEEIATEFASSVHAAGLNRGNLDSPTCTDCHGEHDIRAHTDPLAKVNARNVAQQVCASCHDSLALTEKYGLASHTFKTFSDSFHGLAMRGGSVEVVNCASCHAAHAIKSHLDPTSTVHRDHLLQTCGECHPGANERFANGAVHVSVTAAEGEGGGSPILYWVSTLYTLLILVVVGGMIVHNGLDFFKKLRRKLAMQKGLIAEPYVAHRLYLRMTAHERCQHAVLVLSFTLLVVTGFMLRFPEAWWVHTIRGLSTHAFEWRGWLHRGAGVVLIVSGLWHTLYLTTTRPGRALLVDLLPRRRDLTDPFKILRYNLGLSPTKPAFGRFSYIEKTEYWAMMWGSVLMGLTGVFLWFENTSIGLFSKLGYDVSRTVHFYEAILATLAIIVWHFYFVIFNPDVYPMNLSWLTGRMSELEMLEEHPEELARLKAVEAAKTAAPAATEPPVTPPPPPTS